MTDLKHSALEKSHGEPWRAKVLLGAKRSRMMGCMSLAQTQDLFGPSHPDLHSQGIAKGRNHAAQKLHWCRVGKASCVTWGVHQFAAELGYLRDISISSCFC